jgi:hypothetical protein
MQIVFMAEHGLTPTFKPLSFSKEFGRILLFGLPLFGFWLPYIGFTTFFIDESETEEGVEVECFLVQFVLFGVFIVYKVLEKE